MTKLFKIHAMVRPDPDGLGPEDDLRERIVVLSSVAIDEVEARRNVVHQAMCHGHLVSEVLEIMATTHLTNQPPREGLSEKETKR